MLSAIKMAHIKNPKPGASAKYANFDLEDMAGSIRCILWPSDFETYGEFVQADAILVARGVIDRRGGGDEANLIVNELIPLQDLESRYTSGVVIRVDEEIHGADKLSLIREVVRAYPGNCELHLMLRLIDGSRVLLKSNRLRVEINEELRGRINELLGEGNFQLMTAKPTPSPPRPKGRRGAMQAT